MSIGIRPRLAVAALAAMLAITLRPAAEAASSWGSSAYGDPPGWCTNHSDMWTATVVTNDPLVPTNPERETFYGFHANPGYDEWYGYFYGDFRGRPNDSSGWVHLLHEDYPRHYHWNFADSGWAVHGHVKQYIAYYNWTFGGECAMGSYGSWAPPPFMADQYGYPVVDIYVDSKPPFTPRPEVVAAGESWVEFSWAPVADQGDGQGVDFFASGVDHYTSWLTVGTSQTREQVSTTAQPRHVLRTGIAGHQPVCVHVVAVDRVHNASPVASQCARALAAPQMPPWTPPPISIRINPWPRGLTGLDSWLWLDPVPMQMSVHAGDLGVGYVVTATPVRVDWQFGDGASAEFQGRSGFGQRFPQPSSVTHTYQRYSRAGYEVKASVSYDVTWSAIVSGRAYGPYPMGGVSFDGTPITYPVEQAQPELLAT